MENILNKIFKARRIGTYIGFGIFAIAFIAMFIFIFSAVKSPDYEEMGYELVNATITRFSGEDMFVSFTYNSTLYEAGINYYDNTLKVGDCLDVYVNPADLTYVYVANISVLSFMLPVGIFFAIFVGVFVLSSFAGKNRSKLVKNSSTFEAHSEAKDDSTGGIYPSYDSIKKFDADALINKREGTPKSEYGSYGYFHIAKSTYNHFIFEDRDNNVIAEINKTKTNLIKGSEFEFVNKTTGTRITRNIGMTVTTSTNDITTNSTFKIDGIKAEDYIAKSGLEIINTKVGYISCEYDVLKMGERIASIHPASKSTMSKFGNKLGLGNVSVNGFYDVDFSEDYIDDVILVLFILSRIQQVGL